MYLVKFQRDRRVEVCCLEQQEHHCWGDPDWKRVKRRGCGNPFDCFGSAGRNPENSGLSLTYEGKQPVYFRDIEFCWLEGEEEQTTATRWLCRNLCRWVSWQLCQRVSQVKGVVWRRRRRAGMVLKREQYSAFAWGSSTPVVRTRDSREPVGQEHDGREQVLLSWLAWGKFEGCYFGAVLWSINR